MRQDAEAKRQVFDTARQQPDLARDGALADRHAEPSHVGQPARRRAKARDAAEGRGNTHAAADVGAQSQRRAAGGDDRALAAAAAAGRPFEVPGIVGAAVERIVGLGEDQQLGGIGLAEHDCARIAQAPHVGIVGRSVRPRAPDNAASRRRAREVEAFLGRHRHAGQWRQRLAATAARVDGARLGAGRVVALHDDGVKARVHLFDANDVRFDRFHGRDLAAGNAAGEPRGTEIADVGGFAAGRMLRHVGHRLPPP